MPGLTPVASMTFAGCSMLSRLGELYWAPSGGVFRQERTTAIKAAPKYAAAPCFDPAVLVMGIVVPPSTELSNFHATAAIASAPSPSSLSPRGGRLLPAYKDDQ